MYGVDPDRVSSMYESLTMEVNLSLIIDFHSKSNQTKASKVDYLQKNYIYTTIRLEKNSSPDFLAKFPSGSFSKK